MAEIANFNLESLLDGTIEGLADMPEFKPFPAGTHRAYLTLIDKTAPKDQVNKHPAFELKLVADETMELANSSDTPVAKGDATNVLYMLDNELGQGNFKKLMSAVAEKFGQMPLRALAAEVKNVEALIVTKVRMNKDKTQAYTDVVEISIL